MSEQPGADPWVYFTQTNGGSWENWDNSYFAWVGDHILWIVLCVVLAVGTVVLGCCLCLRCFAQRRRYKALATHDLELDQIDRN